MHTRMRLLLIRHGQAEGNKKGIYLGCRSDVPLSSEGKKLVCDQAKRMRELSGNDFFLFTSSMKRCIETADILWPKKKPKIIDELKEIDFGLFEGESFYTLNGNENYQRWIDSGGEIPFPEGESKGSFIERCMDGLGKIINTSKSNCVVVAHGGTIMAILSTLTGGNYYDFQVKNLGGYIVELDVSDEGITLLSYNSI